MTKRIVLILVIVLTAMLAMPSVRAEDSVDPVVVDPGCECTPITMTVVSDTTVHVIQGNAGGLYPRHAVAAWEPYLIDPNPPEPNGSVWDLGVDHAFTGGADWIWESGRTLHPVEGDIVYFQKTFFISGYPTAGTLYITCDNGYEAWLNGNLVGSAQLGVGWEASNLTQSFVDFSNWQSVEAWNVSGLLNYGTNTLVVKAANEYRGSLDGEELGTIDNNPGGLIFQLDISHSTCPPAT
jgi:hypothetical protein